MEIGHEIEDAARRFSLLPPLPTTLFLIPSKPIIEPYPTRLSPLLFSIYNALKLLLLCNQAAAAGAHSSGQERKEKECGTGRTIKMTSRLHLPHI